MKNSATLHLEELALVAVAELLETTEGFRANFTSCSPERLEYNDLRLGAVDASVVVAAERLKERTIATLDRRHFSVVHPNHIDAFTPEVVV